MTWSTPGPELQAFQHELPPEARRRPELPAAQLRSLYEEYFGASARGS
ncbi:hypothetical protein [Streptomyces sp. KL116D]